MYQHCIFCSGALGANEVLERFPVGRRLAFDAARGRLWVVCPACRRWNLTPLEERWEAIEDAERLFRDTRLRASTDNIGIARLREGLELVRVGRPTRGEFAAWRYGDQLGRRRHHALIKVGVGAAVAGALVVSGVTSGLVTGVPVMALWMTRGWATRALDARKVGRLRVGDRLLPVKRAELDAAELRWALRSETVQLHVPAGGTLHAFVGDDAARTAGMLLPKVNAFGATDGQIRDAVREIERVGDPARYFLDAARIASRAGMTRLVRFPVEARLALEMAAHEERERRALEGELAELEQAWKDAEEIAGIADDLLLPAGVAATLERLKRG